MARVVEMGTIDQRGGVPANDSRIEIVPAGRRLTWRDRVVHRLSAIASKDFEDNVRTKSYSMVNVETTTNFKNKPVTSRPNDELLIRAWGDNPWLRIKYGRLCSSLASLDVKLYEKSRDGLLIPLTEDYPMYDLVRRPNPLMFGWDFRFLTELYIRVSGACFWRPVFDVFGVPAQIWLYPAHWVIIIRNPRTWEIVYYDVRQPNGYIERLGPHELLWLRTPDPLNPYFKGLGEVNAISTEVDTYELASEADRRFFENDATPKGALIAPGNISPQEALRLKDDWKSKMGAPDNYGETAILTGGLDYKTFREGRREMDFVDVQKYLRDVILAGVHPHIIGISENVNKANAEAAEYTYGKWELSPRVKWWEEVYNTMLAPYFHEAVVAQIDNPVPEDREFKLKKSQSGLQVGAIMRNEWRKENGYELLPPEIGDVFLIPGMTNEVPGTEITEDEQVGMSKLPLEPGGREGDVVDPSIGQPIRRPNEQAPPGSTGGGSSGAGGQGGTPGGMPQVTPTSPTGPAGTVGPSVTTIASHRFPINRKAKKHDKDEREMYASFGDEFALQIIEHAKSGDTVYLEGDVLWLRTLKDAKSNIEKGVIVKARLRKNHTGPVAVEVVERVGL
jgi:phage portal protein BeeE